MGYICSCIILPSPVHGVVPPASDLQGLQRSIRFKDIFHIPMGQGYVLFCMEQIDHAVVYREPLAQHKVFFLLL